MYAMLLKPWVKPLLALLAIILLCLGFVWLLHSYGQSQYQLGYSDKTSEVLSKQQTQLAELITTVNKIGEESGKNAKNNQDRMLALETSANGLILDASKRVLLVAGTDGKCKPTEDWRTAWNKANALSNQGKR